MLSKLYSTENNNTGKEESMHDESFHSEEPKEKSEPEIWELESSKSWSDKPRSMTRSAKEAVDFQELLDDLYVKRKEQSETPVNKVSSPTENDDLVSQQILALMAQQTKDLYKKKKPLPRSAIGSMYGKVAEKSLFNNQPETPEDDPLLDYLLPTSEDQHHWDQNVVSKNEHIALKQEEMESTQAIVEAPTTLDLWHCIEREINREDYPKYYPNALAKAIEHASKKDPYMALTIFEKAKQKSIQSYISGCTIQVYNAMLLLRWEIWRDINGMLDLAEEMTVNGIEHDNNSRRIIRAVVQEIESEGGYSDEVSDDGVFWNAEERRNCNLMKELAGKWMISE